MTARLLHPKAITRITRSTPFDDLPELLRVEEAAAWLGCGKGLVFSLAKQGKLPSVRLGRLLRIRREGLQAVNGGDRGTRTL